MKLLTVKDAARLLEVDMRTVYRLVGRRELPAFKVGRQWRMRLSDIESWIEDKVRARETGAVYRVRQAPLFDSGQAEEAPAQQAKSGLRDSAFSENNGLPVHRWAPWIAGFSAMFVEDALEHYLPASEDHSRQMVLDPFAGVGTTLVTALLRGHSVCGFEINPYAAEACKLKLGLGEVPVERLEERIENFRASVTEAILAGKAPDSRPPAGFRTRGPFFSPSVARKVLLVKDYILSLKDEWVRRCFRLAFASEMVGFSNYSYEPSLCRRTTAGKDDVVDAAVVAAIARKLSSILADIRWARRRLSRLEAVPKADLYAGDFFKLNGRLADGSVDLVVTSPPYVNNYHYIRNSRPQVYWLDLVSTPGDLKNVESGSFGKFWQTVRGGPRIELAFQMAKLERALDFLRGRNAEKGQYGGPGWANYAATYFNDCGRFAQALSRLLKPGARAVVVLGNSILQGVELKTDQLFGEICELHGLTVTEIRLLRKKRTGTSIIQSSVRANAASEKTSLYETAVVVARPA
ncbi:MAG: helix-turn-helix domain-containing protein [Planctomycetes bacterium]|nr:helix-turn-helix domain-containing protein [Planctomycetota bacterium]